MRRWFCLVFFSACSHQDVVAQSGAPYVEVISGDSFKLFFESVSMFSSARTTFSGKDCSRGYRLTRISSDGMFEGSFKDFLHAKSILQPVLKAEGQYKDGKKHGLFTWYYDNANVMYEGAYVNDRPTGRWTCYAADGTVTLVLQFDSTARPLIWYMYDNVNKIAMVKDGAGEARFISQGELPYSVSGRVKDGLPEGEWIGEVEQIQGANQSRKWIRKESYRSGVVVQAKRFQSGRITDVCCDAELSGIYPLPAMIDILLLESIPVEPCPGQFWIPGPDPPPAPRSAVPASDLNIFSSSVKSIILSKYQGRQVGESYDVSGLNSEENRLVMHFDSNENGRPVRVKLVSSYGREFFPPIRRALESQTTWSPNQTKLVLTVYIRMGVSTYGYRINFSLD